MINKVFLEGVVTKSAWGRHGEAGAYFITVKQEEKMFNDYEHRSYFSAYANRPLAAQLAKTVQEDPNCHLYIEGKLRTFFSTKDNLYHMTVLIEKFSKIVPKS